MTNGVVGQNHKAQFGQLNAKDLIFCDSFAGVQVVSQWADNRWAFAL